jgi:hypothetical protein
MNKREGIARPARESTRRSTRFWFSEGAEGAKYIIPQNIA